MIYYEDMQTKAGFSDGEDVPSNAWSARTLYITALNHVAKERGSNVRVVAYDRPGMHNPCLMIHVTAPMLDEIGGDPDRSHPEVFDVMQKHGVSVQVFPDEGFREAEEICHDLNLDQYLTQRGTLRNGAEEKVKAAMKKAMAAYEG